MQVKVREALKNEVEESVIYIKVVFRVLECG